MDEDETTELEARVGALEYPIRPHRFTGAAMIVPSSGRGTRMGSDLRSDIARLCACVFAGEWPGAERALWARQVRVTCVAGRKFAASARGLASRIFAGQGDAGRRR